MSFLARQSVATPHQPAPRAGWRALGLVLLLALSACGQKGPLTLPAAAPSAAASAPSSPR